MMKTLLPWQQGIPVDLTCIYVRMKFVSLWCGHACDVCSSQGLVVVWELHVERRGRPERACTSWEHRGQTVTSLCWDTATLRVFAGDVGGKVSCVRAGSSKLGKVKENLFVNLNCHLYIFICLSVLVFMCCVVCMIGLSVCHLPCSDHHYSGLTCRSAGLHGRTPCDLVSKPLLSV